MQLLIIDVQKTFKQSKEVVDSILQITGQYDDVVYLYDVVSGEGENLYDLQDEFLEDENLVNRMTVLTKEYAFFRGLMDSTTDEEFIIELGKAMIKNGITDARDIAELDEDEYLPFERLFNKYNLEVDFNDFTFYIPEDLKENLQNTIKNGVHIVGGAYEECLREVCLLLDMIEIEYKVLNQHTY